MKKKDKESASNFVLIRNLILVIIVLATLFLSTTAFWNYLRNSELFLIRTIVVSDPSMQFIKESRLVNLKGQNIFTADLASWARRLQGQYSEIAEIRLQKRFPDQIVVITKKRIPFAKIILRNKEVLIDYSGVILSVSSGPSTADVPMIMGNDSRKSRLSPGDALKGLDIQTALAVIRLFRLNKYLSIYKITKIDVSNLSQIEFYMTDALKVIIDQNNLRNKIQMLSLMLSQAKLKLEEFNYIDLRFQEPIMGRKNPGPK